MPIRRSVEEALDVLVAEGEGAKVLAGGQSLLPLLSMRLAAPTTLVDINRVPGLAGISAGPDGVRVGALVRHAALLASAEAAAVQPLLARATANVAHPAIRNRGTTVGSIAHADPSGEMTSVLALTDGSVTVATPGGPSTIGGRDFFVGPLETSVHGPAVVLDAFFPALAPRSGTAFAEIARRKGDYAVCGRGRRRHPGRRPAGGLGARRRTSRSGCRRGARPDRRGPPAPRSTADWAAAGELARGLVDPDGDLHASADYRRQLVGMLTERALARLRPKPPARSCMSVDQETHRLRRRQRCST